MGVVGNSTVEAEWDKFHSFTFNLLSKELVQFVNM